jgi:hypothetical protein
LIFRERLIHFLAYKPSTKSEILIKLNKDGVLSEREKEQLDGLIQLVSTFNAKLNSYELSNEIMLNEIKDDWQFYNPTEKLVVRKNISKLRQSIAQTNASSNCLSQQQQQPVSSSSAQILKKESGGGSAFVSLKNNNSSSGLNRLQNTSLDTSLNDSRASSGGTATKQRSSPIKSEPEQFKPIIPSSRQHQQQQQQSQQATSSNRQETKTQSKMFDSLNFSPTSDLELSFNENGNKKPSEKENYSSQQANKKFKSSLTEKQKEIEQTEYSECVK